MTQVMIRIPVEMLAKIDEHIKKLRAKNPGIYFSRADAIRNLIALGLDPGYQGPG